MKVLMVSPYPVFPTNDGGRRRIYHLARNLARRADVALACPSLAAPPEQDLPFAIHQFSRPGPRHQLFDPALVRRLRALIARERPDVLLLEYIWNGLQVALARCGRDLPLILDAFDVATVRFRRAQAPSWPAVSLYERFVTTLAQRVLVVSAADRAAFRRLGLPDAKMRLVPNGVDTDEFFPDPQRGRAMRDRLGLPAGRAVLLFFGQLAYGPNREGLGIVLDEVMPRLDRRGLAYTMLVAGRGLSPDLQRRCRNGSVRFLGPVERMADYINAADILLAPIPHGSGTRLKLLESAACGTPAVTTTVGAEGLDLGLLGGQVSVADDWDEFARLTIEGVGRPRQTPPEAFIRAYDWRHIVARMELP